MALSEIKIRNLINELAKDILEEDEILKLTGVTKEEYDYLQTIPSFNAALTARKVEWRGADNTPKRVKANAAAIVEELMIHIFRAARDSGDAPLSAKVRALAELARIAGLGALEPAAGSLGGGSMGNVFNLNITYSDGAQDNISIGAPMIEGELYSEGNVFGEVSSVFVNDEFEEL
jgi:hypothetical protein